MGLFAPFRLRLNKFKIYSRLAHCFVSKNDLNMRYVAAYLLAVLGGNSSPSTLDVKKIIESVGVGYDEEKASMVCKNLEGKDINELIELGKGKMASMPSGGAASAGSAPAAAGGDAPADKKRRRKQKAKKNLMMTWALDCLIK